MQGLRFIACGGRDVEILNGCMGRATGRADLPLHGGRIPKWLSERMGRLGRVAVEALMLAYGREEVLRRLSHPFWFQSLGCVMGMDWHSSGITTSVLGALKTALTPVEDELGLAVCGGRGRHSRATPSELAAVAERWGLDGEGLARTSRLVAKVDNAALQDGFQIYLHGFIVAADGGWAVIQQGMATERGLARRYHWLSHDLAGFVDDPHVGIEGAPQGRIVNLADRRSAAARSRSLALVADGPDEVLMQYRCAQRALEDRPLQDPSPEAQAILPHLIMPTHHEVRPENVVERRLHGALAAAAQAAPDDFEALLQVPGLGPRTLASLALISEVLHGAPSRFTDPARFALAHGGKDGHPFPVPLHVYDAALRVYRDAIERAKLGRDDRLEALRRLSREAQRLETVADGPSVTEFIRTERRNSWRYGGMTVDGPARPPTTVTVGRRPLRPKTAAGRGRQLALPLS